MDDVACVRETPQEPIQERAGRGTQTGPAEEPDRSFLLADLAQLPSDGPVHIGPIRLLTELERVLQPLLVIQSQKGRLPSRTEPTARQGMIRVAFELDGPTVAGLDEQAQQWLRQTASQKAMTEGAVEMLARTQP